MKSPLISVIIPVYNKEEYVAKLISCVQNQTFRDYECIIVDDGSTDNSGAICDDLTANDENSLVVHIPNGGVSHARNTALDIAKGEYITFLDSDDEIPTDYLQNVANDIIKYKPDMVIGAIKKVSESGEVIIHYPFEQRVYTMQELLPHFAEAQRDCGVFGWCVNKTFKRELAADCRFDESLTLSEDFDYYLKIYQNINTVYFNCENCYLYLYERGGFSKATDSQIDYLSQAEVYIRFKEFLESNGYWNGDNKNIVSKRIQDYLFYAIFHANKDQFDSIFNNTKSIFLQSGIRINFCKMYQFAVLKCIKSNCLNECKALIALRKKIIGYSILHIL